MPERLAQLERWLVEHCGLQDFTLSPASADASFRRYFRVVPRDEETSFVAMDAPPDKEDCAPFIHVAESMRSAGLHVPDVHAADLDNGFLLLEDLGSVSYLDALSDDAADVLYSDAIAALVNLQEKTPISSLPPYDEALLVREMQLFPDWLLGNYLGIRIEEAEQRELGAVFEKLASAALAQPVVAVHRDYHSRNLMQVAERNPGIIDFQDAVAGPVSYDIVSLLRDCYVAWPLSRVEGWAADYHERAHRAGVLKDISLASFLSWFDLMGAQRHLKAAGIFARLYRRDGKPGYLGDIPRTLNYIVDVAARRPELAGLADLIVTRILPALPEHGTAPTAE